MNFFEFCVKTTLTSTRFVYFTSRTTIRWDWVMLLATNFRHQGKTGAADIMPDTNAHYAWLVHCICESCALYANCVLSPYNSCVVSANPASHVEVVRDVCEVSSLTPKLLILYVV